MEERFKLKLKENGADVEATIKRFLGREDLYEKFIRRFPGDQNYKMLEEYLSDGNYEEAYKCAHTLKGVSANLGFDPVFHAVSTLVEELRGKENKEVDKAKAEEEWQEVRKVYQQFIEIINEELSV